MKNTDGKSLKENSLGFFFICIANCNNKLDTPR